MEIKISLDGEKVDITKEELQYGLNAILAKRNERKTLNLSSSMMDFDKVFDITRELNRYAEEQKMNVTIIAVNPEEGDTK